MKSAFLRDQAPESEKCLVLSHILTVTAREWYKQLSGSTRTSWKVLLEGFMAKYGGKNSILVIALLPSS